MATTLSKKSKSPKSTPAWARYKGSDRAKINARKRVEKHEKALLTAKIHAELDRTGSRAKKALIKQGKRDAWMRDHI